MSDGSSNGAKPMLEVRDIRKEFYSAKDDERVVAVDGVSFVLAPGAFYTLLGPSGCGKTTTLRSIAGLESPDSGEIIVDGRTLYSSNDKVDVRASRRGLGMVFQSYAIWPNMTVFQNVAFPMKVLPRTKRPSGKQMRERVERVLEVVQLSYLIDRPATDLSGGQQQRLALARALVMEPPLLLLDEPLSNLDAKLREATRGQLKRLQRDLGITTLYVTHDQVEALAMSDVVAVMSDGRVEQMGSPAEIYDRPASHFVADFIGNANFIPGVVAERSEDLYVVRTDHGELRGSATADLAPGDAVMLSARPETISLEDGAPAAPGVGRWAGQVRTRGFLGDSIEYLIVTGGYELQVHTHPSVSIGPGAEVTVHFDERECSLIPTH